MKKKLFVVLLAVVMVFSLGIFVGCENDPEDNPDYGALNIANVTVEVGKTASIYPLFTQTPEKITYSFSGDNISISGNIVTGISAGTVTVTATTAHHSKTFTVTVTPINYGTLTINDVTVGAEGGTAVLQPDWSHPGVSQNLPIKYTFEGNDITIENNMVTANCPNLTQNKTITVTATTEHHSTTFTVTLTSVNFGTLSFKDSYTVALGNTVTVTPTFSIPEKKADVTLTYDQTKITIEKKGDVFEVTPLVPREDVTVTASTIYHSSTTFVVKTTGVELVYDNGAVDTIYAGFGAYKLGGFDYASGVASSSKAGEITFALEGTLPAGVTYDAQNNTLAADRTVTADTSVTFKAQSTTGDGAVTIAVKAAVPNTYFSYNELHTRMTNLQNDLATRLTSAGKTEVDTLFVGDSFFNPIANGTSGAWWSNFYTDNAGYDAFTVGISSAQVSDWNVLMFQLVTKYNPKNIVLHIGTNDIFDGGRSAAAVSESLIELAERLHYYLPDAQLYYYSIEPRVNLSLANVIATNDLFKTWCDANSYITWMDSYSKCFVLGTAQTMANINPAFYKSCGIHPSNSNYVDVYLPLLEEAGHTMKPLDISTWTVPNYSTTVSDKLDAGAGGYTVTYGTTNLTKDYLLTGKITIGETGTNPHFQFGFNGSTGNRLYLCDNDGDGTFGVSGSNWSVASSNNYELTAAPSANGSVFYFELWMDGQCAYLFIGSSADSCSFAAAMVGAGGNLYIGSEACATTWSNMNVVTKKYSPADYATAIQKYATITKTSGFASAFRFGDTSASGIVCNASGESQAMYRNNGITHFSGNFVLSFDCELLKNGSSFTVDGVTANPSNIFSALIVTNDSKLNSTWNVFNDKSYHLIYRLKDNATHFNISWGTSGGELANGANLTSTSYKVYVVRTGNTLYMAYVVGTQVFCQTETANVATGDSYCVGLWNASVQCKITNDTFSQTAADITAALAAIGKNA